MAAAGAAAPAYDRFGIVARGSEDRRDRGHLRRPGLRRQPLRSTCTATTTWPRRPQPVGSSFKPYVLAAAINRAWTFRQRAQRLLADLDPARPGPAQDRAMLSTAAAARRIGAAAGSSRLAGGEIGVATRTWGPHPVAGGRRPVLRPGLRRPQRTGVGVAEHHRAPAKAIRRSARTRSTLGWPTT